MSDIEKQDLGVKGADVERTTSTAEGNVEEIKRAREIQSSNVVLRKLKQGEAWMDEKMGGETQGIDRVLEENKDPPSILNVIMSTPLKKTHLLIFMQIFLLWWSLNVHVGVVPLGIL